MKYSFEDVIGVANRIQADINETILPPASGKSFSKEGVIYIALLKDTRGYIEQIGHQINGTYANGWYDACAVMIRRLVETLIIETFESHSIANSIKNPQGDFFFLRDLIFPCITETSWNMSRNAKSALPRLKEVGDKSAHSRRFVAHRQDIDGVIADLRVVVQELLYISKIRV